MPLAEEADSGPRSRLDITPDAGDAATLVRPSASPKRRREAGGDGIADWNGYCFLIFDEPRLSIQATATRSFSPALCVLEHTSHFFNLDPRSQTMHSVVGAPWSQATRITRAQPLNSLVNAKFEREADVHDCELD